MVLCYLVEYKYNNGLSSFIVKFERGVSGYELAKEAYNSGVRMLMNDRSDDIQQIELQIKTTNNGLIVRFHYDTQDGFKNADPWEVYADG